MSPVRSRPWPPKKIPDFIGVFSFFRVAQCVRRYSVLVPFFVSNCGKQYHGCTTSFFRGFFVPRFRAPVRGNPRRNAACWLRAVRPARCPSRTCAALLCAVPCVRGLPASGSSSANVRPTREGAQLFAVSGRAAPSDVLRPWATRPRVPISGKRPACGAFRRPTVRPRAQPCAPCRPRSRRFGLFAPDCRRPCAVPRPRRPSGSSDVRRVSRSCAACGASRSRTYRATRRVRSPGNRSPSGLSSANVRADRVRTSAPPDVLRPWAIRPDLRQTVRATCEGAQPFAVSGQPCRRTCYAPGRFVRLITSQSSAIVPRFDFLIACSMVE